LSIDCSFMEILLFKLFGMSKIRLNFKFPLKKESCSSENIFYLCIVISKILME